MVELLKDVVYKNHSFLIHRDSFYYNKDYLQVEWDGIDSVSKQPRRCKGRKWYLSPYMTHSELIQTALAAVLAIEEHEAREAFRYKGQAVFGPHFNAEALVELCKKESLDVRPG